MGLTRILYLFIIIVCGFSIQTVSGFGSAVFSIPLALMVVNKSAVLPAFYILSALQSLTIVLSDYQYVNLKLFLRMIGFAIIGVSLAFVINQFSDVSSIERLIGIYIFLNSALSIYNLVYKTDGMPKPSVIDNIFPVLSGMLQAIFGIGGPFIAMYMNRQEMDKRQYRANICFYWCFLNPVLIVKLILSNEMQMEHIWTTLWLIPAMYIGIMIGKQIIDRISIKQFKLFTNVLLILISLSIIF